MPKRGKFRTIDLSPELVNILRAHRAHQAEVKIANRATYRDHGLVFAKEWRERRNDCVGDPLQMNNLGQREFAMLLSKSGVRTIRFHGMRHTAATLMLKQGVPVKVVAERLGHEKTSTTEDLYMHALPTMGRDAARVMGSLLHG